MKRILLFFILIAAVSGAVYAQDSEKKEAPKADEDKINTVFSDIKPGSLRGWGSPVLKLVNFAPEFNGPFALMVGGEGGLIINRYFYIGGGGYSLVSDIDRYHVTGDTSGRNVNLSYGGIVFKGHFFPTSVVNFSLGTVVGGGVYGSSVPDNSSASNINSTSGIFVLEPEIYVFLNLAKFCRFGIGGSYRFLIDDGTVKSGLAATNLWGYSINFVLQFGRF